VTNATTPSKFPEPGAELDSVRIPFESFFEGKRPGGSGKPSRNMKGIRACTFKA